MTSSVTLGENTSMPDNSPSPARLSTESAATYVGLSTSSLNKLRMGGDGPSFLKLGRRVVYDMRDLDAWLNTRRRRSTCDDGSAAVAAE
jgi:hypothetical protein